MTDNNHASRRTNDTAPIIQKLSGFYHDGWLAPEAQVLISHPGTLQLTFYLPPGKDPRQTKILELRTANDCLQLEVERGGLTPSLPIELKSGELSLQIISLGVEDEKMQTDERELGVFLAQLRLDGSPKDWRAALSDEVG